MDYIKTWKEVIQSPSDFYKRMPTTGGYTEPLTFASISYIILAIMSIALSMLMNYFMFGELASMGGEDATLFAALSSGQLILMAFIYLFVMFIVFICLFVSAGILNIIYRVLGGIGSYEGTFRFISYTSAVYVLSWIPILGLVSSIYGIYLYIVGGKFVHNVSMWKSSIAVLLLMATTTLASILLIFTTFMTINKAVCMG
jgi:hypothetical protein